MTTIASTAPRRGVRRRQAAPRSSFLSSGAASFGWPSVGRKGSTIVVFFRAMHYPVCGAQLAELDRRLDELSERGIDVIAVSTQTRAL